MFQKPPVSIYDIRAITLVAVPLREVPSTGIVLEFIADGDRR